MEEETQEDISEHMARFGGSNKEEDIYDPLLFGAQGKNNKEENLKMLMINRKDNKCDETEDSE